MPIDRSKRHATRALRRPAKGAAPSALSPADAPSAEESAFWNAHGRALARARAAAESSERLAAAVAKQRASVETLADRARASAARSQELSGAFDRVTEVFERLGLVALNAGLEGARLGEGAGRAVLLVSDEVRTQALRGGEAVRELCARLTELSGDLAQMNAAFDAPRIASTEMVEHAARATSALADTERSLVELEAHAREATGSDPETVRALSVAHEQAQALMGTLGSLGGKLPPKEFMAALRPMLEPLARVLAEGASPRGEASPEGAGKAT